LKKFGKYVIATTVEAKNLSSGDYRGRSATFLKLSVLTLGEKNANLCE